MADDRREAIDDVMAKAGGIGWQTRGEAKELPKILWPDELPLKVIRGSYDGGAGLLVATDRRLIFIDKGLMSLKVEDFGYDKITSVQYKTGMVWARSMCWLRAIVQLSRTSRRRASAISVIGFVRESALQS